MNSIEHAEHEAALAIVDYTFQLVKHYIEHPGDVDAAMVAVLVAALEKVTNREIYIERMYR